MKKLFFIFLISVFSQVAFAAGDGGGGSSSSSEPDLYKEAVQLVNRGKKLDEKGQTEKALKMFENANKKLLEADKKDRNNPDILNYLGFTFRKIGNYPEAEKHYLAGLAIKPDHNGINEYLGELYVKTNRINKAKERLEILKNCDCEEYLELREIINRSKM